ncbi:hypothetical protein BJ165DRAFT_1486025 [Panaeolus papilionaceus]|nr:hypothetical protein BJ165DRAFT_1486025 [Panaeolus papilionaceus]
MHSHITTVHTPPAIDDSNRQRTTMDAKLAAYDRSGHSNVQQLYNPATSLGSGVINMVHSDGADPSDKQPKRILLCFIDARPTTPGFQPTAHYAMVALPSSYEVAALVAYKAFQSKMLTNNIGAPGDIVLMIKGFVRFGESSTNVSQPSNIWADIYPPEDWIRIVKDGDEILVCPKVPLIPTLAPVGAHKPESVTSSRSANTNPGAGLDKTIITGPTVTLYCRPLGSSKYRQGRVPFTRSLEVMYLRETTHNWVRLDQCCTDINELILPLGVEGLCCANIWPFERIFSTMDKGLVSVIFEYDAHHKVWWERQTESSHEQGDSPAYELAISG